jgi:hypothetical protein
MSKPTKFLPALVLGAAGAMSMAAPSLAVSIDYVEQASGSGSLNGVAFTNANIVLTMSNDTSHVIGGPPLFENLGTVTLSVNGGTAVTFTDSTEVFSAQAPAPATVGFADLTRSLDILDDGSALFATYDLKTSIGPISGVAFISANQAFPTTGGDFILTSAGPTSTFTARTAAVPAPPIGRGLTVAVAFGGVLFGARRLVLNRRRRALGAAIPTPSNI